MKKGLQAFPFKLANGFDPALDPMIYLLCTVCNNEGREGNLFRMSYIRPIKEEGPHNVRVELTFEKPKKR